jgi:predicted component of type VI protein secretion system
VDDANVANETDDAKAFRETGWILKFANRDIADVPLAHGKTAIGRKAGRADVVIQGDGYISSAHVSVEINDDGVYVTDLNSTNGTFIAETRLDPLVPIKVKSGTRIRIGETEFEIAYVDADSADTGDSQSDAVDAGGSTDAGDSKDAEESPEAG